MLPALVASLSLFESLGGVTVIAARLRELSSHLRAELVEAGFTLIGAFGVETGLDDATLSPHITGVEIDFAEPSDVAAELSTRGVQVTAKDRHGVRGLRVAPHVYSTMEEVGVFVRALVEVREQLTGAAGAKL